MVTPSLARLPPVSSASETPREPGSRKSLQSRIAVGSTIGGYVVSGTLGEGGMGQVYLATDERLGRQVALKVLPPDVADAEAHARFLREARALARVEHHNVVRVHASGDTDGLTWMALEVVDGEPLSALTDGGPIDEETALLLCAQIARGLAAVHKVGVIHRDVKPSNVLVDQDATVKLIDFGVAQLEGHHGGFVTRAGVVVGTPHFMSPEQARGAAVDARSDAWGLGATLYALLTGVPPFFGADDEPDLDILARVVRDPVPDVRVQAPETSAATAALVASLLRKDLTERPADLDDVAVQLEGIASGAIVDVPVPQDPPSATATEAATDVAASAPSLDGPVTTTSPAVTPGSGSGPIVAVAVVIVVAVAVAVGALAGRALIEPRIVERVVEVKVPVEVPVEVKVPVEVPVEVPVAVPMDRDPAAPPAPATPEDIARLATAISSLPDVEHAPAISALIARDDDVAIDVLGRLLVSPGHAGDVALKRLDTVSPDGQDTLSIQVLASETAPRSRLLTVVDLLEQRRNDTALVLLSQTATSHKDATVRARAAMARDSIFKVE
jgi:serine/threonine protein kinase